METVSLTKKTINQIFGKVVEEESRRIYWDYEIGVHTINCETCIEPPTNHTVITTITISKTSESIHSTLKNVVLKRNKQNRVIEPKPIEL